MHIMKRERKIALFPKPKSLGKRNWGEELLLVLIPKVLSLKILKIKKNKMGNLQYHHKKNECGYIVSGSLLVKYEKNKKICKKILKKGDCFHFPPGAIHQEQAITNCTIIEASSPHFNDRVRVEAKYGMKAEKGLPSTRKSDIVFK